MYKKTMRNISVFLPAKKRSTRVPNKNSRNFANIKFEISFCGFGGSMLGGCLGGRTQGTL